MNRRTMLATLGSGVGVGGCTSRQRTGRQTTTGTGGSPSTTAGTASQTATPAGVELTVEFDALQRALVFLNVDRLGLYSTSSSQYLYLRISAPTGPAPTRSDLSFRFADESYAPLAPGEIHDGQLYRSFDSGSPPEYGADEGDGWILFELPETGDASDAALVWPGGEWHPDEGLRARLGAPFPSLSVERWQAGSTVALQERTTFQLDVENTGNVPGRFVGGINAEGWHPHRPVAHISRRVPPGETATWDVPGEEIELVEEAMADQVGDGEADIHYELVWPGGSRTESVRVVEE